MVNRDKASWDVRLKLIIEMLTLVGIILQAMSDVRSEYQSKGKEESSQEPLDSDVRELEDVSEKTKDSKSTWSADIKGNFKGWKSILDKEKH